VHAVVGLASPRAASITSRAAGRDEIDGIHDGPARRARAGERDESPAECRVDRAALHAALDGRGEARRETAEPPEPESQEPEALLGVEGNSRDAQAAASDAGQRPDEPLHRDRVGDEPLLDRDAAEITRGGGPQQIDGLTEAPSEHGEPTARLPRGRIARSPSGRTCPRCRRHRSVHAGEVGDRRRTDGRGLHRAPPSEQAPSRRINSNGGDDGHRGRLRTNRDADCRRYGRPAGW